MSETAVMGASPKAGMEGPGSYLDNLGHDGSPESYPEVARELTMLRGAATSVDMKLHEAFEELNLLFQTLKPVLDQSPKPTRDVPLQGQAAQSAPPVTTGVGADMRHVYNHLGSLEEQLDTLAVRIRVLRGDVRL